MDKNIDFLMKKGFKKFLLYIRDTIVIIIIIFVNYIKNVRFSKTQLVIWLCKNVTHERKNTYWHALRINKNDKCSIQLESSSLCFIVSY